MGTEDESCVYVDWVSGQISTDGRNELVFHIGGLLNLPFDEQ